MAPALTIAGLAAATLAVHVRDPHVEGSWGLCPFRTLTGLDCPGCGGMRGVNDLTHGQLAAAISSNALLIVFLMPLAIGLLGYWLYRAWRGPERVGHLPERTQLIWGVAVFVVLMMWWVVRNLPGLEYLRS